MRDFEFTVKKEYFVYSNYTFVDKVYLLTSVLVRAVMNSFRGYYVVA
jgi:hypothetical protein